MKKSSVTAIVLGVIGALATMIGSITKHAYTTGYSYFVTEAEEQAIISKAETAIFVGIALLVISIVMFVKTSINKD